MINIDKVNRLIGIRLMYYENNWPQPNIDEDYWIPLTEELTKSIDETITFWNTLTKEEFILTLEILDEIIQKTQSHEIINAIKRIGKEKCIDDDTISRIINRASCWFDEC